MNPSLPPTASVANPAGGEKLSAPSALRNRDAIAALLAEVAPAPSLSSVQSSGQALELASGTGEHVIRFAAALPDLMWHPTDPAADRRASIDAHVAQAGLGNIAPARDLDACTPGWAAGFPDRDLVVLVNLLHLVPPSAARTLLHETARALRPGGVFVLYGPFLRNGLLISEGDRSFHGQLTAADPAIGYKDDAWVTAELAAAGCPVERRFEMAANNLAFVARRPVA